jgi:hypothetical protein
MRPITNGNEYFDSIRKYLSSIIYTDSIPLKQSGLTLEHYRLAEFDTEPQSSFIQAVNLEVTDYLSWCMGESGNKVDIFRDNNPICESFIINDINIDTYQSMENNKHFFHKVIFSAVNTTRYNTVSFKAELYQDTTPMINTWNNNISQVTNSKDVSSSESPNTLIFVSTLDLLNNTNCVIGQENDCGFAGFPINSNWSQRVNDNYSSSLDWLNIHSMPNNVYSKEGYYQPNGNIKISDFGPDNLDLLINQFKK